MVDISDYSFNGIDDSIRVASVYEDGGDLVTFLGEFLECRGGFEWFYYGFGFLIFFLENEMKIKIMLEGV